MQLPWEVETDLKPTSAGIVSFSETPFASAGPLSFTGTVYVSGLPLFTGSGESPIVTPTSASCCSVASNGGEASTVRAELTTMLAVGSASSGAAVANAATFSSLSPAFSPSAESGVDSWICPFPSEPVTG